MEGLKVFLCTPPPWESYICILTQKTMAIYDYNSYSYSHVLLPILPRFQQFGEISPSVNWEAAPRSGLQGRACSGNLRRYSALARSVRPPPPIAQVGEDAPPRPPQPAPAHRPARPALAGARPPSLGVRVKLLLRLDARLFPAARLPHVENPGTSS